MAGIISADIHPINNLRILNRLRRDHGADDAAVARWVNHWIHEGFLALEALVARHSTAGCFCHGDSVTVADLCLVPQMYNARRFGCDLAPFPTLVAIDAHCRGLEAFRRAEPESQPDATQ
jgi:maleylacetoacetate isomerase